MSITIECPSGLKGKVRGLKGKDGRFLTDRKLNKAGLLMDAILESCWLETVEPSVYKTPDLDWSKVLVGDRFYALIQIKIAAQEDAMHKFRHQCSDRNCREGFDQTIDLSELPVRMLEKEQVEAIKRGENSFSTRMPTTEERKELTSASALALAKGRKYEVIPDTGDIITFKLFTGADERRMDKLKKQGDFEENELIHSVAQRIQGIKIPKKGEGEEQEYEEIKIDPKKKAAVAYLDEFDLPAVAALLDRMDAKDCGVETLIEIDCPACGNLMRVDLPLDENFFFPRNRRVVS